MQNNEYIEEEKLKTENIIKKHNELNIELNNLNKLEKEQENKMFAMSKKVI